jgi:hypothetical protein
MPQDRVLSPRAHERTGELGRKTASSPRARTNVPASSARSFTLPSTKIVRSATAACHGAAALASRRRSRYARAAGWSVASSSANASRV